MICSTHINIYLCYTQRITQLFTMWLWKWGIYKLEIATGFLVIRVYIYIYIYSPCPLALWVPSIHTVRGCTTKQSNHRHTPQLFPNSRYLSVFSSLGMRLFPAVIQSTSHAHSDMHWTADYYTYFVETLRRRRKKKYILSINSNYTISTH